VWLRRPSHLPADELWVRLIRAVGLLVVVLIVGTVGYLLLGLGPLDAVYQSVTTVTTVGFRELGEPTPGFKTFTIVLILLGTGSVLYALGVLLESLVEGRIGERFERRRMERQLADSNDHIIVCGWGRVGKAIAASLHGVDGIELVVIDSDERRIETVEGLRVHGDATDDKVLVRAGIERARALVAALSADADNVYITLAARRARPELFIVARARVDTAEVLLLQAGANRVVNPQAIGGSRMAALVQQPHVADFLDVAMHSAGFEFRLEELTIAEGSPMAGLSLRDAQIRERSGALVLAMRGGDHVFRTNPDPTEILDPGEVLIAIGTAEQLRALENLVGSR
jgi:voltage-gated potassium channel